MAAPPAEPPMPPAMSRQEGFTSKVAGFACEDLIEVVNTEPPKLAPPALASGEDAVSKVADAACNDKLGVVEAAAPIVQAGSIDKPGTTRADREETRSAIGTGEGSAQVAIPCPAFNPLHVTPAPLWTTGDTAGSTVQDGTSSRVEPWAVQQGTAVSSVVLEVAVDLEEAGCQGAPLDVEVVVLEVPSTSRPPIIAFFATASPKNFAFSSLVWKRPRPNFEAVSMNLSPIFSTALVLGEAVVAHLPPSAAPSGAERGEPSREQT